MLIPCILYVALVLAVLTICSIVLHCHEMRQSARRNMEARRDAY